MLFHKSRLVAGTKSGRFVIWRLDFDEGVLRLINIVEAHKNGITSLKLMLGCIVSVSEDTYMRIWNDEFEEHFSYKFADVITDVVLARDNAGQQVLLTSNMTGTIQIYNVDQGVERNGVL